MPPIAHIETPFKTKFGVPRQAGLVDFTARIVFEPDYRVPEAVRGLEDFDYIWLIWQFHKISSPLPGSIGDMACDRSGAKLEEVDAQRADGGVCNQAAQPSSSMATQPQPANPSPAKGDPSTGTVHEDDLVWAPNVIVPNGDVDDNRTFKLKYSSEVTQFQIFIYNRGGRLVFNSDDPAFTWDGTSRGTALPQGAYVWVAKFRDSTGHPREEHGTVTIIR